MSEVRKQSNQIVSVIQCSVKVKPEEFKDWVKNRSSKYILNLKEEKLISYEWHLSDDETEATLVELLVDSDGYMQRIKNHVESPIASEVMELVDFKGWLVFGNAKPDLVEALSSRITFLGLITLYKDSCASKSRLLLKFFYSFYSRGHVRD